MRLQSYDLVVKRKPGKYLLRDAFFRMMMLNADANLYRTECEANTHVDVIINIYEHLSRIL